MAFLQIYFYILIGIPNHSNISSKIIELSICWNWSVIELSITIIYNYLRNII